jgi:hypothetical protein
MKRKEASSNIFSKQKEEIERIPEHFNTSTVCLPRYARKFLTFISIKSISSILPGKYRKERAGKNLETLNHILFITSETLKEREEKNRNIKTQNSVFFFHLPPFSKPPKES